MITAVAELAVCNSRASWQREMGLCFHFESLLFLFVSFVAETVFLNYRMYNYFNYRNIFSGTVSQGIFEAVKLFCVCMYVCILHTKERARSIKVLMQFIKKSS